MEVKQHYRQVDQKEGQEDCQEDEEVPDCLEVMLLLLQPLLLLIARGGAAVQPRLPL